MDCDVNEMETKYEKCLKSQIFTLLFIHFVSQCLQSHDNDLWSSNRKNIWFDRRRRKKNIPELLVEGLSFFFAAAGM